MNTIILACAGDVSRCGRLLLTEFARSVHEHRFLHALALASLALAVAVGAKTGNMPDFGAVGVYGGWLALAFAVSAYVLVIGRFVWLAFVEKHPAPFSAFLAAFARLLGDAGHIANAVNGLFAIVVFVSAFGVLKGAIAILSPFFFDRTLAHIDRILAFGHAPYERLWWLVESPLAVATFNLAYNLWFVILIVTSFAAAMARRDSLLRHQFMAAFMLTWTVGGFLMAMGFSSAGPCYFARLGLGGDYRPLMDALKAASQHYPVWALATQDILWQGYVGARAGSAGISAFPSMHVALATLFALYWSGRSRLVGMVLWAFAGVIYIGSIVLAWHYAVDGVGGFLVAVLLWKLSGLYARRHAGRLGAAPHSARPAAPRS